LPLKFVKTNVTDNGQPAAYGSGASEVLLPGATLKAFPMGFELPGTRTLLARVVAVPCLRNGTLLPDTAPVSATDSVSLVQLEYVPKITISNNVVLGADATKCSSAVNFLSHYNSSDVTYCFVVTNRGDSFLNNITIENKALFPNRLTTDRRLAPMESVEIPYTTKLLRALNNTARVTAIPTKPDGSRIMSTSLVEHNDSSAVGLLSYNPVVTVQNTVYLGDDGSEASCTTKGVKSVVGKKGDKVVYCFLVSNRGDTYLSDAKLVNEALSFTRTTVGILAPRGSFWVVLNSTIDGNLNLTNVVVVTASPSLADGAVIAGARDVVARDTSNVERLLWAPKIAILNSVVLGADADKCDSALIVNYLEDYGGSEVIYCFEVKNTGNSRLTEIKLTSPELQLDDSVSITALEPNEVRIVALPAKITRNLNNTVTVSGFPVNAKGEKIDEFANGGVRASDGSGVGMLSVKPAIEVSNKVYVGDDLGASCGSKGVEMVTGKNGTAVVYCFKITNTGDTYLSNITLANVDLGYEDKSMIQLAPSQSMEVPFLSLLTKNLINTLVVKANPTMANGKDIEGTADVSASDQSQVILLGQVKALAKFNETGECIENNWNKAGGNSTLVCATKQAYLENLVSPVKQTCIKGERFNVTINADIIVEGSRFDLGWYVASDGGDAMNGTCHANGLVQNRTYKVLDPETKKSSGQVQWLRAFGGDDDACGEVLATAEQTVVLPTNIVTEAEVLCMDDDDDDKSLDISICFTWRIPSKNTGFCSIGFNTPGTDCSCYCSTYSVHNITVVDPSETC
jgi:hypothetical protein